MSVRVAVPGATGVASMGHRSRVGAAAFLERWGYVLIVVVFAGVAVTGFAPRSAAIVVGDRPNPALVIHVHAFAMILWFGALLAQATLVALNRQGTHRRLGRLAAALGPLLVVTMVAAAWHFYDANIANGRTSDAARALLIQGRGVFYFALFFGWALVARRRDRELHKRMMLLATVALLPAAVSRVTWLPTGLPQTADGLHLYMLALLLPGIAYDLWRDRRVHRAWWLGIVCFAPWIAVTHFLWSSAWWLEVATG